MNARRWIAVAAAFGFLGVALGAFGAHALRSKLSPEMAGVYRVGVEYHLFHALALLCTGLYATLRPGRMLDLAAGCFALGVPLFSGSLYALAVTGNRMLGIITPFGGLLFLAGWILLGVAAWRSAPP